MLCHVNSDLEVRCRIDIKSTVLNANWPTRCWSCFLLCYMLSIFVIRTSGGNVPTFSSYNYKRWVNNKMLVYICCIEMFNIHTDFLGKYLSFSTAARRCSIKIIYFDFIACDNPALPDDTSWFHSCSLIRLFDTYNPILIYKENTCSILY